MAWLRATPKGAKSPRGQGVEYELPDIEGSHEVIDYLSELGWCGVGFDGLVGLNYVEIEAYCRVKFNYIPYWLPTMLHSLSSDYAVQSRKSYEPNCPPPYLLAKSDDEEIMQVVRKNVHDKLKAFF